MEQRRLSEYSVKKFQEYLVEEEKSNATVEKYIRDIQAFMKFADCGEVKKILVMDYKQQLIADGYAVRSVNSMLASINSYLTFMGWEDCKVKCLKMQHQIYTEEDKELTKEEYLRLLKAAKDQPRLYLTIETICATGIRVSELQYFTVERVRNGEISVSCKGKNRKILLPRNLRKHLLAYAGRQKISTGRIFVTKSGKPVNRSNLWNQMKKLCSIAGVKPAKIFPHNLRKLFARTFYGIEKDIAKLEDILGHCNINTTRIYIVSTGTEHRKKIECLGLVV